MEFYHKQLPRLSLDQLLKVQRLQQPISCPGNLSLKLIVFTFKLSCLRN